MHREFAHHDRLIVLGVPLGFPPMVAAIQYHKVAEAHGSTRILIDQGTRKTEFDLRTVYAAMRRYRMGWHKDGDSFPRDRETRRPVWPVSLVPDGLPKGVTHG